MIFKNAFVGDFEFCGKEEIFPKYPLTFFWIAEIRSSELFIKIPAI